MKKQSSKIPKEIIDAITSTPEPIKINNSAFLFPFENSIIIPLNEEQFNKKPKKPDKEYKIGNYLIKKTLGQGTFGKVKLGIYLPNKEKVAIKILEKSRIIEKDDEIRVKREFDMLAQFNHPNVILVAEIFESVDSFYSVMEYCEGGELFNYIVKNRRLCEEEASYFFFQLINGLEYIHSLGIVHRDLKPENLLLTDEHILKIIDFGLSNYFKENQKELLVTPCGSPCYASPEMVAGKKYNGFKIDVWSCGIILYAMLCGYLPFEDSDNEILFKKILECKLTFPSYIKSESKDLIKKILVTDPEKRITIPQIKEHPFFIKGKELFEQEFSICQATKDSEENKEADLNLNILENIEITKNLNNENSIDNGKLLENSKKESTNKNIEKKNSQKKELDKKENNKKSFVNTENSSENRKLLLEREKKPRKSENLEKLQKKVEKAFKEKRDNTRKKSQTKKTKEKNALIYKPLKTEYENSENKYQYIDKLLNPEKENGGNNSKNKGHKTNKNLNYKIIEENIKIKQIMENNEDIKENKENKENLINNKEKTKSKITQYQKIKQKSKIQKKLSKIQNNYTSNTITKSCRAQAIYPLNITQTLKKIETKNSKKKKISLNTISNINSSFEQISVKKNQINPKNLTRLTEENLISKINNHENNVKINKVKNIKKIKVYLANSENQNDQEMKNNINNKIERLKTDINKRLKRDINKLKIEKKLKSSNYQINNTTGNLQNIISEHKKKLSIKCHKKIDTNYINNLNNDDIHSHKISNLTTNANATAKKIKTNSRQKYPIDSNIHREHTYIYNLDTNSLCSSNKNSNLNQGIFYGKRILNKYNKILENTNSNNYKHSYINTNVNDYSYRKPLFDFDINKTDNSFHLKTENFIHQHRSKANRTKNFSNSVGYNNKFNTNFGTKKNLHIFSKMNYLPSIAKITNYNKIRKTPHYIIKKNNNINTNKNKFISQNNNFSLKRDNVLKKGCTDLKRNSAIPSIKRKPSLTIRNTVINLNMIDTSLLVTPSLNRHLDIKRNNYLNSGRYNVPHPPNKYILSSQPKSFYTKIFPENKFNNKVKKNARLSRYNYRISERISNKTKSNFLGNAINDSSQNNSGNNRYLKDFCTSSKISKDFKMNSFNQLIKKYKYPELIGRMALYSNSAEKTHTKFNSMKIENIGHHDRIKNIKQMQTFNNNNVNNNLNNTTSFNKTNVGDLIGNSNYNLPSLIVNKVNLNNNKGYFVQAQPKYFCPNLQQQDKNDNRTRQFHLKGINQKLIK